MLLLNLQNIIFFLGLFIFAYLSWRKIETGIYAAILSLPLYLVKAEIFGIPTTALEIGIYALFIIWFIKNYRPGFFRKITDRILADRLLAAGIALLLMGVVISTVLSSDLKTSAGILKGWFFDPVLFFAIFISVIDTFEKRLNVLKIFAVSGFVVAVISLFYWFQVLAGGVSYDFRLHGFYTSPNYLAMYLAVPFIVSIWFLFRASGKERYLWLAAAIIMAVPIYLTYSYAAWFAIAAAVFLIFLLLLSVRKRIIFSVLLVIFSALLIFGQLGTSKFENLKSLSYRSSTNSRLMIWRAAWMIGKDHPIFGIGPGNFQKYYLDYQKRFSEPYLEWAVPEPHNIFLAFWLEAGIMGLSGFALLLYWFFKKGIFEYKKARPGSARHGSKDISATILLISLMAYILIHGLFDTTYWKNDLAIMFWVIIGTMLIDNENN